MEQAPKPEQTKPEVKPEEVYVRGTHHRKPFIMEEGPCLFEHALTKEVLDRQQKRWAYVHTLFGETRRLLVKVWVWLKNKPTTVWADAITGTLFLDNGTCLSSKQRKIVRWGAYDTSRKEEVKPTGRTETQTNWNKGI